MKTIKNWFNFINNIKMSKNLQLCEIHLFTKKCKIFKILIKMERFKNINNN